MAKEATAFDLVTVRIAVEFRLSLSNTKRKGLICSGQRQNMINKNKHYCFLNTANMQDVTGGEGRWGGEGRVVSI